MQNFSIHWMGKTVNELHAMPKLLEQTRPKQNAPALYVIQAGKVQKKKNKQKPRVRYWKTKCPQNLAELLKNMKLSQGASGSSIFTIELDTFPNKSWVYDTGCGTHICNTTQGLRGSRKLKPGALRLYVGNGQRAAVKVIETYHLCLHIGLVIVLNNCHYTPYITRGIISVSRLYDDGYVNCFVDNTIQVSRNNMVYFSVVPKDGIFEIDLLNPNTIDSSMYIISKKRAQLNLDSAILWHCNLGHISKKRIEKLQHDGLLNSTDLRAFEKYVLCMSRKMARKPYTRQVKRVKDLLGLIHTDDFNMKFYNSIGRAPNRCSSSIGKTRRVVIVHSGNRLGRLNQGYPKETMSYFFYYPPENKVIVARNAEFLENNLITQKASGSLEDLEIIQEEDTHPYIDTSLNHEDDDLKIDEPQSDIIPIRRSTRTRHAPDRMCLYIDAEEHELGDLGKPVNYKAALLDPESDKWLNTMKVEMQSMKDNDVWDLVDLPPNGETVGSKWLFKKKTGIDGTVHTYKARLVAKGYTQTRRIDYEETFSPVADNRAIRILIAIASFFDYEIWKMDFKTAFLNGYLSKKVYKEQPEGFVNPKYSNRRFHMDNSKRGSIPMQEKLRLSKSQGTLTPAELKRMQNVSYVLAVGSIMYDVRCTRPDVAFA
nr:hypothetical protein [Tanacetum cinerariifolium]